MNAQLLNIYSDNQLRWMIEIQIGQRLDQVQLTKFVKWLKVCGARSKRQIRCFYDLDEWLIEKIFELGFINKL